MQTQTLFKLLLSLTPEPNYKIAEALGISTPCALSRLCNGLTNNKKVLERAAAYYRGRTSADVDPHLLTVEIDAKTLVALALHIRSKNLASAKGSTK